MQSTTNPSNSISPDDALPPVEPPTAGFLVKLFVVPGVIVSVIVMVWLFVRWLSLETVDPQQLLTKLRSRTEQRYHAAVQLASVLQDPRHAALLRNKELAKGLGSVLEEELQTTGHDGDAAQDGESSQTMQVYLCRALQQFQVTTPAASLAKAATTQDVAVRINAVECLGRLAENVREPVSRRLLPQAAKTCRAVADAAAGISRPEAAPVADQLRKAADQAQALAAEANRVADGSTRCTQLAALLTRLAQEAQTLDSTSGAMQGLAKDLQDVATAISTHVPDLRELESLVQPGGTMLDAVTGAVNEPGPLMRFSPRYRKEIDDAATLRIQGVIALSQVGGPAAWDRLKQIVETDRGVMKYNAALGLCREALFDPHVAAAFAEMLDQPEVPLLEPKEGLTTEQRTQEQSDGRRQIATRAIAALTQVQKHHPTADFTLLLPTLEKTAQSHNLPEIRTAAKTLAESLRTAEVRK